MALRGLEKSRAAAELAAKAAKPLSPPLTPELLEQMRPFAAGAGPFERMAWAAACVGAYAGLRPNELLGSNEHRDRALRAEQITFRGSSASAASGEELPVVPLSSASAIPHAFTIALGPTKADQQGRNPAHLVAGRPAVEALWQWMQQRSALGGRGPEPLFAVPGDFRPLSVAQLIAELDAWGTHAKGRPVHFLGRCFRRGMASAAAAAGAPVPVLQQLGRWAGAHSHEHYVDQRARFQRFLAASSNLAPAARR
jgi:integrase